MLPRMCAHPACMNIEVNRVSQKGEGVPGTSGHWCEYSQGTSE